MGRTDIPRVGIGLLYSQILLLLIFPIILVFHYAWSHDQDSVGLWVLTGLTLREKAFTCGQSWVVRIDTHENWYLNSRQTSPAEMPGLLEQQLGTRNNCAVYLDVDSGVPYGLAVLAINSVETTQAKVVVLVTPKDRKLLGNNE